MSRKYWSHEVTHTSNALDLEHGVFQKTDPAAIARSLKRSAEQSRRRKSSPYRSAMSMLTFYINRAGRHLSKKQLRVLERAKDELRAEYGR
jgi:hemerythrin-like domain-containing protein